MSKSRSKKPIAVQDTLRLSERGVGMLLGDLEQALLEAAWSLGRPATARELHSRIARTHPVEQITAVTVINRLTSGKPLMTREKLDHVYHYSPTVGRDEFVQMATRRVAERVLSLGADAVSASFVDVLAERDPEQLAELGRLIRKKLRERDEG